MIRVLALMAALAAAPVTEKPADAPSGFAQSPVPAPTPAGPSIESILARPEFVKEKRPESLLKLRLLRMLQWFLNLLNRREAMDYALVTRFAVLAIAGGVALYGLYRVLRRRYVREPRKAGPGAPEALVLEAPERHLQRAQELLSNEPRAALREGLLALLSVLERRRFARPDRVKTNRELALELGTRGAPPEVTEAVQPLLAEYDAVFYALSPVSAERVAPFLAKVRALETVLG